MITGGVAMQWIGRRFLGLAVVYVMYLVAVFFLQRRVLFPAPALRTSPVRGSAEVVTLPQASGAIEALFLPPLTRGGGPAPIFIFTHGNGELVDDWIDAFTEPRRWGWGALLVEFPGYGRSTGAPSERSVTAATASAYEWASRDPRIDRARIVAYGRSLGGGAAAQLAADQQLPALILESTFTGVRPLMAKFLVPGFLVRDPFDNLAALRRYRGPLLVFHGNADEVIPFAHGVSLAASYAGSEFHELSCGHNDCPRSWPVIRKFLTAKGLIDPAGTPR